MFIHNLKYTLITLFKNKALIFWTFAFPILLATFFNMAFSDIEKNEKLDIINIAIVENDYFKNNEAFKTTFEVLSNEKSEERLFATKYVDEETAKKLLEDNEIDGYLLVLDKPTVVVNKSGINQTILKYITEEIYQNEMIFENIINEQEKESFSDNNLYSDIYLKVLNMISENNPTIKDISNNNLSYTMIEFYTLIAMTCLYGGILSMTSINQVLPNMSSKGKRMAVSSLPKKTAVLSSVLASYIIQLIGVFLLFIYTIFILNVDYGNNLPLIIILALVGSLAGLSLGILVATVFKTNDNVKTGIIISITMLGCFLSGMMGITMKYIIDKNVPIINKINPANMITDGFYSLYYYDTNTRYYFNLVSLIIFSLIMIGISIKSLRRQDYDSV